MESFSRQSGSPAEVSVAKLTNAEKCTPGLFLKWLLFDQLAYLSHSGRLSSCKCRTLYWLFGIFLLFAAGAFSLSSFEPSSSNLSFSSLTGCSLMARWWPIFRALLRIQTHGTYVLILRKYSFSSSIISASILGWKEEFAMDVQCCEKTSWPAACISSVY